MNDIDPQLEELAGGFREALRHSVYLVRRLDADGELSAAQLSTLKMLLGDGQRVGEIARNLGVRVPSATEQIIKLERAGLARREPDPADSRAVRVILTPEGRAAVDAANKRRNQVMADILSGLTDRDRKALAEALPVIDKINASLQN
ncbi:MULTISPECIES: MarR family winged helix-turn-helix transcriptional regulator [Pseudarthrobacter]|uniref:DNA-binding MarR family transcriptional regulator n=1 Tax=Pseudarthrobacter niigatensis TaxID=369935 RepID=A0AAJ1SYP7_9MICC|nr:MULTISPECIES: MarR family transcriptional regulator [Pseudarthrobacter]MDQ0147126.1 DNA-binding MarR family transcriptional regulator [Pseudarthrobacter niigatensis]MDQ0267246.1 DNA-binding MarR family transcriptional regulator [Pseudarthrobacter niigatensis]QDG61929.1 MarR family transcriptional regulator [Pseudarthrobacter sp. NIBRBAC000502771]